MSSSNNLDWEKLYPLSSDQVDEFLLLQEEASRIENILQLISSDKTNEENNNTLGSHDLNPPKEADVETQDVLSNALQSLKLRKHAMLDSASWTSNDDANSLYQKIQDRIETSNALSNELSKALYVLDMAKDYTVSLNANAELLLSSTQRILREKTQIESIAQEIEIHLSHFTFLEELTLLLRQPIVQHSDMFRVLGRLETCLLFMQGNRHFTDAAFYETRYRQCLLRILTEFRNQLLSTVAEWSSKLPLTVPENDDLVQILVTFQTGKTAMQLKQQCTQLKAYALEIEKWCPDREFDVLRNECVNAYIQARLQLVMALVQAVVRIKHTTAKITWATELCGFIDAVVDEELSLFRMIFDAKHLQDIKPLLITLSKPILDVLHRTNFAETLEELADLNRFLLARHISDHSSFDPLSEFTEARLKQLGEMCVSICSNEREADAATFLTKSMACRNLVQDILSPEFQGDLLSIAFETYIELLDEQKVTDTVQFTLLNKLREQLYKELQELESHDFPSFSTLQDHTKGCIFELDGLLIEVQDRIIKECISKCMKPLLQCMDTSSKNVPISMESILKAYQTWSSEFQTSVLRIDAALDSNASLEEAFVKSVEKSYNRFHKWVHDLHPSSTELTSIMDPNECVRILHLASEKVAYEIPHG